MAPIKCAHHNNYPIPAGTFLQQIRTEFQTIGAKTLNQAIKALA